MNDDENEEYVKYELNIYDNEISSLLKISINEGTPSKYMYIPGDREIYPNINFNNIKSLIDAVNDKLMEDKTLSLNLLLNYFPTHSVYDISMIYYLIKKNEDDIGVNMKALILINDIFEKNDITNFNDIEDLNKALESWIEKYKELQNDDQIQLKKILQIQDSISHIIPTTKLTPYIITKYTLNVLFDNKYNYDGTEIYNLFKMNINVPFVRYIKNIDTDNVLTKIYIGDLPTEVMNIDNIDWIPNKIKDEYIYFTIYINNMDKNNIKNYIYCIYNIKKNIVQLKFNSEISNLDNIFNILKESIELPIIHHSFTNISANFKIFYPNKDLIYDKFTFVHLLTNESLFNFYFNIYEQTNMVTINKVNDSFKIFYKSIKYDNDKTQTSPTSAFLKIEQVNSVSTHSIKDNNNNEYILNKNNNYININISKAYSENIIKHIYNIINLLIYIYDIKYRQEVITLYSNIIPDINNIIKSKTITSDIIISSDKKSMLEGYFQQEYTSEQLSTELNKKYNHIPPNISSIKLNEILNKLYPDEFPLNLKFNVLSLKIRTFFNDIFTLPIHGNVLNKLLHSYYPDVFITNYSRHATPVLIVLPHEIEAWTKLTIPGTNYNRQVLPFPYNNPLFHFTCDPYSNKPYPGWKYNKKLSNNNIYTFIPSCYEENQIPIGNMAGKKSGYGNYIEYINSGQVTIIGNNVNMLINVDNNRTGDIPVDLSNILQKYILLDNYSIKRLGVIYDKSSFLHSILHIFNSKYRTLNNTDKINLVKQFKTQLLNINLNVYKQELYDFDDTQIKDLILDDNRFTDPSLLYRGVEELLYKMNINIYVFSYDVNTNKSFLEIPRHKYTHIRYFKEDSSTILLFKYVGNVSTNLKYPNYNILMSNNRLIYDKEISKKMYTLLYSTIQTYSFINNNIYLNLYNNLDIISIFKYNNISILYQFIDGYGKSRGYILSNGITIFTYPSPPINVPIANMYTNSTYDDVITFIKKEPSKVDITDDNIIGLWFNFSTYEDAIYIPIHPLPLDNINKSYEYGLHNPYIVSKINYFRIYSNMEYERNILLYMINWLYVLSKRNINLLSKPIIGYINSYNINNISTILPNIESYDEAVDYINSIIPNMIYDNKIYCLNDKLYDDLTYYIYMLDKNSKGLSNDKITQHNIMVYDNTNYNSNFIQFNTYMDYLNYKHFTYNDSIVDKILLKYSLLIDPYIYKYKESFYIIQNVIDGDLNRALNVSYIWYKTKKNIGFFSNNINNPDIRYNIYGIDMKNQLTVLVKSDNPVIYILQYIDSNRLNKNIKIYASILPL